MNKEKQRIVIAEFCGYRPIKKDVWGYKGSKIYTVLNLPDYLNDLNAIHEAEELLDEHQWNQMFEQLIHIRWRDKASKGQKQLSPSRATAEQRSEAFLKTIGRWEE